MAQTAPARLPDMQSPQPGDGDSRLGFRPLYLQVRAALSRHLAEGRWQPGMMLPSEHELAREMGVSQGTVRKALDAMTADRILVRRQGRGTFVAEFEDARVLFQFFKLYPEAGERLFPTSSIIGRGSGPASEAEAAALAVSPGDDLWRLERVRLHGTVPVLVESIALPAARFPGFDTLKEVPNNVYQLYSRNWSVTIVKAAEKLKAIAASAADADALGCDAGEPLLRIERVAYDINAAPVELRISRCLTGEMYYASDLT